MSPQTPWDARSGFPKFNAPLVIRLEAPVPAGCGRIDGNVTLNVTPPLDTMLKHDALLSSRETELPTSAKRPGLRRLRDTTNVQPTACTTI